MLQIPLCPVRLIRMSLNKLSLIIFVSLMAGLGEHPAAQTASLLPAVDLRMSRVEFTGDTWPADFNGDGLTDLVGSTSAGIAVTLGNGDGTFRAPIASGTSGKVLAVGDVNRDGRPDVVAENDTELLMLPGTTAGPLAAPRVVMQGGDFTFATVADMDNDGLRDLVVGQEGTSLHVLPGNGDLTFDPPFTQTTGAWPFGHIVVDLDNDGLRDVVVAHRYEWHITVFHNGGTFAFTGTDLPIGRSSTDVTARDLNGDAKVDLVVSARGETTDGPWDEGMVYVFLGNGDATFGTPAVFPTAPGTQSVVVGDFTRDGRTDVATTNRSSYYVDEPCGFQWGIDSVSILAGRGDGTFVPSVDFALGPTIPYWERPFIDLVGTLNTSDLNRDGHVDLITSQGKILLNVAPRANRPPVVSAGDDMTVYNEPTPLVQGTATDADHHLLRTNWSRGTPAPGDGPIGTCLDVPMESGDYVFYLTADDGQGGVTSDAKVMRQVNTEEWPDVFIGQPGIGSKVTEGVATTIDWFAQDEDGLARLDVFFSADGGATFEPVDGCTELPGTATGCTWNSPGPATNRARIKVRAIDNRGQQGEGFTDFIVDERGPAAVVAPWTSEDVGGVGAAGSTTFDPNTGAFTLRGSGADVWGTADEFHWTHQTWSGDFEMTALVSSIQNVDVWTKAGLMMRDGTGAGARHASLFVTPTTQKGIAFQRRPTTNGTSVSTSGPALAAPVWIRLTRTGDVISAYSSPTGIRDSWTLVGRQTFASLSNAVEIGMAVSSHRDSLLAAATFEVTVVNTQLWSTQDIGAVGLPLEADYTGYPETLGLSGSGTDIWGTADAFAFHSTPWTLDGTLTARVRSIENTNAWAKTGVMFRESLAPGSKHVMLVVSAAKGIAMQYRTTTGGASSGLAVQAGVAPEWVRIARVGDTFTGYASENGLTWRTIGSVTIAMSGDTYAGLPVTSHNNSTLATALLESFSVTR
jgi:hypothetical protein